MAYYHELLRLGEGICLLLLCLQKHSQYFMLSYLHPHLYRYQHHFDLP